MWKSIKKFARKHQNEIIATLGVLSLSYLTYKYITSFQSVKLSGFIKALKEGYITEVIMKGNKIFFRSADKWYSTFYGSFPRQQIAQLIQSRNIMMTFEPSDLDRKAFIVGIQLLMAVGTLSYIKKEAFNQPVSEVDMEAKMYQDQNRFEDFYGGVLVKDKFRQIIEFLHHPERFQHFGARIRRGVLLYGPPGTGKTLLARALANEAGCEFIKVAASEFQQIFVGTGAKRVRQLFANARSQEGGCIIFIDEIDALGSRVNALRDNHETTSTIAQFLSQMDGFKPLDKVVVLASTNRLDLIDPAVLRSGRFDLKVQLTLPTKEERVGIMKTLMKSKLKKSEIDDEMVDLACTKLNGRSGADIEAILNESIYRAMREDSEVVRGSHLQESVDEFMMRR